MYLFSITALALPVIYVTTEHHTLAKKIVRSKQDVTCINSPNRLGMGTKDL